MKYDFFLLFFSVIIYFVNSKEEDIKEAQDLYLNDSMIFVNDTNYMDILKKNKKIVIFFLSIECENSRKAYPYVEAANRMLKNSSLGVIISKVNVLKNPLIAKKFVIEGTPRLFFFEESHSPIEFMGKSSPNDIFNWVQDLLEPIKQFKDITQFNKFKDSKYVLVSFFGDKNNNYYEILKAIRKDYKDYTFASCTTTECLKTYNASLNSVVIFKKFDEQRADLVKFDTNKLIEFLDIHIHPTVNSLNDKTIEIMSKKMALMILFRNPKSALSPLFEKEFYEVAKRLKVRVFLLN